MYASVRRAADEAGVDAGGCAAMYAPLLSLLAGGSFHSLACIVVTAGAHLACQGRNGAKRSFNFDAHIFWALY